MFHLKTNSILNRIDPRLKIVMTFVLIVTTFFISNGFILGLFLAIVVVLMRLAGISILYGLKQLKHPIILLIIMLALQLLLAPQGRVIFEIGFIRITADAILSSLLLFIRLMVVMMSVFILISTTAPQAFILSLEFFLRPVGKIGLKTGAALLIFRMIGRFVPSLFEEANKILKAQASRGLDLKGVTLWMKMRLIVALLLPVFVIAIKRADELSNAMAVRGYVMNGKRSSYQTLRKD